jgi:hypothetical protein
MTARSHAQRVRIATRAPLLLFPQVLLNCFLVNDQIACESARLLVSLDR